MPKRKSKRQQKEQKKRIKTDPSGTPNKRFEQGEYDFEPDFPHLTDISIVAQDGTTFRTHRVLLAAQSKELAERLERDPHTASFTLPYPADAVTQWLRLIHHPDNLNSSMMIYELPKFQTGEQLLEMLKLAQEYGCPQVVTGAETMFGYFLDDEVPTAFLREVFRVARDKKLEQLMKTCLVAFQKRHKELQDMEDEESRLIKDWIRTKLVSTEGGYLLRRLW